MTTCLTLTNRYGKLLAPKPKLCSRASCYVLNQSSEGGVKGMIFVYLLAIASAALVFSQTDSVRLAAAVYCGLSAIIGAIQEAKKVPVTTQVTDNFNR